MDKNGDTEKILNKNMNLIKLGYKITYDDSSLFDRYTIINKDEQKEFRNLIYKYDLICIFELNDFEEEIINNKIYQLYNTLIENEDIEKISIILGNKYNTSKEKGFILLFSYDNLSLFYPLVCDFFEKEILNEQKLNLLKNNLL